MFMHGLMAHVSGDLPGRSLRYAILRRSPGEARMIGATISPLKEKASRPFSFTALSVRDRTRFWARTCGGSGKKRVCADARVERSIALRKSRRFVIIRIVLFYSSLSEGQLAQRPSAVL